MIGLVGASLIAGGLRAAGGIASALGGNRRAHRLIEDAYGEAHDRLMRRQADVREQGEESIAARGLGNAGDDPRYLAGGMRTDLAREQGYEQKDLARQRDVAEADRRSSFGNAIVGALSSGINLGTNIYSAGTAIQGMRHPGAGGVFTEKPSMSGGGVAPQIQGAFGLDPLDPSLEEFDSMTGGAFASPDLPNSRFRVG